jgi:hypothetical protein
VEARNIEWGGVSRQPETPPFPLSFGLGTVSYAHCGKRNVSVIGSVFPSEHDNAIPLSFRFPAESILGLDDVMVMW